MQKLNVLHLTQTPPRAPLLPRPQQVSLTLSPLAGMGLHLRAQLLPLRLGHGLRAAAAQGEQEGRERRDARQAGLLHALLLRLSHPGEGGTCFSAPRVMEGRKQKQNASPLCFPLGHRHQFPPAPCTPWAFLPFPPSALAEVALAVCHLSLLLSGEALLWAATLRRHFALGPCHHLGCPLHCPRRT